jgi:hypothetical protein
LSGAKSTDDIDQRIVVAMMPALNTALGKIGGRLVGQLAQTYGLSDLLKAGDIKALASPNLVIFDDLERAVLGPIEVLGYVNQFVEHEGKKAVVIGNESEIKDRDYIRVREKVIGITFDFQQDVHAALGPFIAELTTEPVRKYVETNKETLLVLFSQSESKNLRVLKQTLWTWDRFYNAIDEELRAKTSSILVVFKLFVALCLEVRSGTLKPEDLRDRVDNIVMGMTTSEGQKKDTPLSKAQRKYPELHLHDPVLTDEVLIEMLCEGKITREKIDNSLRTSEHFVRPEDEPAWRKVWYWINRTGEEFEVAFLRMEELFNERAFIKTGEVMHVFGLRLWLGKIGQLALSRDDIVAQCKLYIDELKESGKLLEGTGEETWSGPYEAAYGLVFSEGNSAEFKALHKYYEESVEAARRQLWPQHAAELIELMSSDVDAFFVKVCWTNDERENTFMVIPVFSAISVNVFVDKLLQLHPREFRTALTALKGRYENGRLQRELALEAAWLTGVYIALKHEAIKCSPIRRFTIENEIGRLIAPLLPVDTR